MRICILLVHLRSVYHSMCVYMQSQGSPLLCSVWVSADRSWFNAVLEELAIKHFCMPRDDPKTEMAAISEEPPLVSKYASFLLTKKS